MAKAEGMANVARSSVLHAVMDGIWHPMEATVLRRVLQRMHHRGYLYSKGGALNHLCANQVNYGTVTHLRMVL